MNMRWIAVESAHGREGTSLRRKEFTGETEDFHICLSFNVLLIISSRGKSRKWRRRAAAKALERQQKLERAETALNTLSLGLPLVKTQV